MSDDGATLRAAGPYTATLRRERGTICVTARGYARQPESARWDTLARAIERALATLGEEEGSAE